MAKRLLGFTAVENSITYVCIGVIAVAGYARKVLPRRYQGFTDISIVNRLSGPISIFLCYRNAKWVQNDRTKFSFYLNKFVIDDVTLYSIKFATQKFKDRTLLLFGLSVELSNTLILWTISKTFYSLESFNTDTPGESGPSGRWVMWPRALNIEIPKSNYNSYGII